MTDECDGCGKTADLQPVYDGDDPDSGYTGSSTPEYLCWDCRHPSADAMIYSERQAIAFALYLLGLDQTPRKPAAIETGRASLEVFA